MMSKHLSLAFCTFGLLSGSFPQILLAAGTPILYFSDLASGPNIGNSDNSQTGQLSGQDGAIVTVWGKNLGTTPGQITVGGIQARVYSWGNATAPADLYTKLGLQMVAFQIPKGTPSGVTTIQATVGGSTSNSLPFTVRSGNIYFVRTTGSDTSGDGSWSKSWRTLPVALTNLNAGDIVYVGNGIQQTTEDGDRSVMNLDADQSKTGTAAMPKAIIGYPGAVTLIGNTAFEAGWSNYIQGSGGATAQYWTVAKLTLTALDTVATMDNGFRIIGNKVSAPLGNQPTGAIAAHGNDLYCLGNEITQVGYSGTSKLYHPIYFQSTESSTAPRLPTETNREIAWNYLHDNFAYDGINIYRENTYSAFMTNHRVHDNYIMNQPGAAFLIGTYITGENWFYNNVIVNAGSGPLSAEADEGHACIRIFAGWVPVETGVPVPTTIHFYNNSVYGCGWPGALNPGSSGVFLLAYQNQYNLDLRNNIFHSGPTAQPYIPSWSDPLPPSPYHNLWFGAGAAPAADASSLNTDPKYVNPASGDLHLQSGSPAIDKAVPATPTLAQPLPVTDFDSVTRPQGSGYDLGAFEFDQGNPPPANPTITLQKSASTTIARVGDIVTFTIQYSNTSSVDATNVVITDPLPAGSTLVKINNGGTYSGNTITWNLGAVPGGGSGSVSFQSKVQ